MLILARKRGEVLVITTRSGDEIIATVSAIEHDRVKLGIVADDEVHIARLELLSPARRAAVLAKLAPKLKTQPAI